MQSLGWEGFPLKVSEVRGNLMEGAAEDRKPVTVYKSPLHSKHPGVGRDRQLLFGKIPALLRCRGANLLHCRSPYLLRFKRVDNLGAYSVPSETGRGFSMPHAHTVSVDPETHLVYFPLHDVDGHPVPRIMRPTKRRSGLVSFQATVPDPVPLKFFYRDPDGNRSLIVQPD
jgi:hypothetical protein